MIDRYSLPQMRRLWSDAYRYDTWLRVELAVCSVMEALGEVPKGTANQIASKCGLDADHLSPEQGSKLDASRILEIEKRTHHDVIAFLTHVEELCGEPARHLHLGMTSSDVLDSSLALLLAESVDLIVTELDQVRAIAKRRASEHAKTPMIGRSHGIHAEPTTLGLTFARWYAELGRSRTRLVAAKAAISVGKIAGAVGTYAHLSPDIEAKSLGRLGLAPETVATQVVGRDRHAELASAIALVGAVVEQIALTIRHWQRTEVGEAEEAFGVGQKGSSAMPHKKNPVLSENLTGLARLLRAYAGAALEDVALWHERDISHSSVERIAFPDATSLCHFMLVRVGKLLNGLVVHPERMRQNLDRSRGLVFSEGILLALVKKGLARQAAYEMVQKHALRAHAEGLDFLPLLASDAEIGQHLSRKELESLFDLDHVLRHAPAILKRALES